MDFFSHQDAARRKTSVLVVYFVIAVVAIVVAVYLAVALVVLAAEDRDQSGRPGARTVRSAAPTMWWNPDLFAGVATGTVSLILLGSLYKIATLRAGGETVARMLGGRPVEPGTRDLDERVLLNVVEEIAIASGTPVPPVFLLQDQNGINAFAAGTTANDAVIGVTRGTIETLTRDELQGVIAHEFSHILNGDMRLNLRLLGVLHGILLIALVGYGMLRSLRHVRVSNDKKGGGAGLVLVLVLLGLAFLAIGYIGVFFGKLIKSAVSRQREYLADASAVQFTRNPGGIAGALKKIGGLVFGSKVDHAMAEEASHLFFGNALAPSLLHLLSTHPPLSERIRRIEPSFEGRFPAVDRVSRTARDLHREDAARLERRPAPTPIRAPAPGLEPAAAAIGFAPDAAVASIGTLDAEHVGYAAELVASIPARLRDSIQDPLGAIAAVYSLLLDADTSVRQNQLQLLAQGTDRATQQEIQRLLPVMDQVAAETRLPIVELAIPALCRMSEPQYRAFRETVERLVAADSKIALFEFALQRLLLRHLAPHFVKRPPPAVKYTSLGPLLSDCENLLWTLAYAGSRDAAAAVQAFARGAARLGKADTSLAQVPQGPTGPRALGEALDRLAVAAPAIKKQVLQACAACIDHDGRITLAEAELLRVIADSLDCPMPPLLGERT